MGKITRKLQLVVVKRVDLLYMDISSVKSKENTGNRLQVKLFGEPHTFVFDHSNTREKWANLLRGLITKEVEETVRRLNIDLTEETTLLPPERSRKVEGESEKMISLLNENSSLTQQLAKISLAMKTTSNQTISPNKPDESPVKTPRKQSNKRGSNIMLNTSTTTKRSSQDFCSDYPMVLFFYGPRFSGKTTLSKSIIEHYQKEGAVCAYIHEDQLSLSNFDYTLKSRKFEENNSFVQPNISILKSLLQSIVDFKNPSFKFIIIEGEFYDADSKNAVLSVLEQMALNKIVCCCYAPFNVRKERNVKDVEVRQCRPFELPSKGVLIDATNPVNEILQNQIIPLLKTPEPKTQSTVPSVSVSSQ